MCVRVEIWGLNRGAIFLENDEKGHYPSQVLTVTNSFLQGLSYSNQHTHKTGIYLLPSSVSTRWHRLPVSPRGHLHIHDDVMKPSFSQRGTEEQFAT